MDIIKSVPTKLEVSLLGTDGKKVSGLSIDYIIYDVSDFSIVDSGPMGEAIPGIYSVSVDIDTIGQYWMLYVTPVGYEDGQESFNVIDVPAKEATLIAENDKIARILGMVQENFRAFDHVYDSEGNQTSSTVKIYASAADCNSDTSPIATYQVTATYLPGRKLASYKVIKV
jgi:hypothetical protein